MVEPASLAVWFTTSTPTGRTRHLAGRRCATAELPDDLTHTAPRNGCVMGAAPAPRRTSARGPLGVKYSNNVRVTACFLAQSTKLLHSLQMRLRLTCWTYQKTSGSNASLGLSNQLT